jgi:hypothetical protein
MLKGWDATNQLGRVAVACRVLSSESCVAMKVGWSVEGSEVEKGLNGCARREAARWGTPGQVVEADSIEGCISSSFVGMIEWLSLAA